MRCLIAWKTRWQQMLHGNASANWLVVGALALVLLWAVILGVLVWQREVTVTQTLAQNANLARTLREHTLRILENVNQSMLSLGQIAARHDPDPQAYVRIANETGLVPDILTQLSLVGADGRFVGSNLDPDGQRSQRVDLSARDHVRVHLDPRHDLPAESLSPDGLFISQTLKGKVSGKRSIQLSRKVLGPHGEVRGVVVASLNPEYFEQVYRSVQLGEDGGAGLVGMDAVLRVRVINSQVEGEGRSIPAGLMTSLRSQTEGALVASGSTGPLRLFGFSRVVGYPLAVLVGSSLEVSLASWQTLRNVVLGLTALLTVVLCSATLVLTHQLRQLEHKHAALVESEARAQAANQAKSEFLVAISHELRTPLTSIQGFSELLAQRGADARTREQGQLIARGALHLNRLLSEILDLAKAEAGAMAVQVEPVALAQVVEEVLGLFNVSAVAKGLALQAQLMAPLPERVPTDALRLKQILHNLLSNAIKFTPAGQVWLRLYQDEAAGTLVFEVEDTGSGVPAGMEEAIFERFRQGHDRVSYEHGGTGLGLTLSRLLAQMLGGHLTLGTPRQGSGACFALTLPLSGPPAASEAVVSDPTQEPLV